MFCYETFMQVTKWQYKIHINIYKKKKAQVYKHLVPNFGMHTDTVRQRLNFD